MKGKSIIFLTTNGSAAIVKGRHAKNLMVAGFVNLSAVVSFLAEAQTDFEIICAGKENNFCLEDAVCAGRIINKLIDVSDLDCLMDDAGLAAVSLDKTLGKNIHRLLKNSEHGRYLSEIGFSDDLKVCAEVDSLDTLPLLNGSVLRSQKNIRQQS